MNLGFRKAAAIFAIVVVAGPITSSANAAPKYDSPSPRSYIPDYYKRGVDCGTWKSRKWVFWDTYAHGEVGRKWTGVASKLTLCDFAEQTERKLDGNHVTGLFFPELITKAQHGQTATLTRHPKGWTCYRLPSTWALSALEKDDKLSPEAYATAQGSTAPAGYCESIPKKQKGKPKKPPVGQFFTWGSDPRNCIYLLELHGEPDPKDPSVTEYPSYESVIFADSIVPFYDKKSCTPDPSLA